MFSEAQGERKIAANGEHPGVLHRGASCTVILTVILSVKLRYH